MEPSSPPEAAAGRRRSVGVGAAAVVLALAAGLPALAAGPDGQPSPTPEPSNSQSAQSGHSGGTGQNSSEPGSSHPNNGVEGQGGTNSSSAHPGNNGHVFIHDTKGDYKPYNVPHVGCSFWVDFWGFDADQSLTLKFVGQAPTGAGTQLTYNGGPVTIAHDAKADGDYFDTEVPVTLDPSGLGAPHPKQGYHVKLTVTTGQPGENGVKHKVFWIGPCTDTVTPSGATTDNGGTEQGGTTTQATGTQQGGTQQGGTQQGGTQQGGTTTQQGGTVSAGGTQVQGTTLHRDTRPKTQVLGTALHRSPGTSGSLPFTGAPLAAMLAAAVAALGGGVGLNWLGRRRRSRAAHR